MSSYLTEDEYTILQSRMRSGNTSITIPRGVARQFFTHVSNSSIKSITDRSMLWQKLLIWSVIVVSLVSFVFSAFFIIKFFGYWSAIAVPLIGIFWAVFAGLMFEEGGWPGMTIILAISLAALFFIVRDYSLPAFFFVISVWTYRATYLIAQHMLTNLVGISYAAFDMLVEHLVIQETETKAS